MNATEVARSLLASIGAPRGAVSVITEPDKAAGFALRVWVSNSTIAPRVPHTFMGHPVRVEKRPRIVAG
jgi:hypothetical protein